MKMYTRAIASNSDMNKNYKACREKAELYGKIFVLKNNQPEAVLFSIAEYEKISKVVEYLDTLEDEAYNVFIESLAKPRRR